MTCLLTFYGLSHPFHTKENYVTVNWVQSVKLVLQGRQDFVACFLDPT